MNYIQWLKDYESALVRMVRDGIELPVSEYTKYHTLLTKSDLWDVENRVYKLVDTNTSSNNNSTNSIFTTNELAIIANSDVIDDFTVIK